MRPGLAALLAVTLAGAVRAEDAAVERLRARLLEVLPGVQMAAIRPVGDSGLYEVEQDGRFGYVTVDGRYFVSGDLYDLQQGTALTERRRRASRLAQVAAMQDDAILFAPAAPRQTLYTVTVFTDIDCGYCRRWHAQMDELHRRGIAVRYLFFARGGPGSASFRQAEAVWCAGDRNAALTAAKRGRKIRDASAQCKPPILAQYELAQKLGINATPALLMPDGRLTFGLRSADRLAEELAEAGAAGS